MPTGKLDGLAGKAGAGHPTQPGLLQLVDARKLVVDPAGQVPALSLPVGQEVKEPLPSGPLDEEPGHTVPLRIESDHVSWILGHDEETAQGNGPSGLEQLAAQIDLPGLFGFDRGHVVGWQMIVQTLDHAGNC